MHKLELKPSKGVEGLHFDSIEDLKSAIESDAPLQSASGVVIDKASVISQLEALLTRVTAYKDGFDKLFVDYDPGNISLRHLQVALEALLDRVNAPLVFNPYTVYNLTLTVNAGIIPTYPHVPGVVQVSDALLGASNYMIALAILEGKDADWIKTELTHEFPADVVDIHVSKRLQRLGHLDLVTMPGFRT